MVLIYIRTSYFHQEIINWLKLVINEMEQKHNMKFIFYNDRNSYKVFNALKIALYFNNFDLKIDSVIYADYSNEQARINKRNKMKELVESKNIVFFVV